MTQVYRVAYYGPIPEKYRSLVAEGSPKEIPDKVAVDDLVYATSPCPVCAGSGRTSEPMEPRPMHSPFFIGAGLRSAVDVPGSHRRIDTCPWCGGPGFVINRETATPADKSVPKDANPHVLVVGYHDTPARVVYTFMLTDVPAGDDVGAGVNACTEKGLVFVSATRCLLAYARSRL